MITDAIDVLDARIINLQFAFDVMIDPTLNSATVMQGVLAKLQTFFDIKNFHNYALKIGPMGLDALRAEIAEFQG